nr:MFS transporter [Sulfobacillus harzensis]
MVTYSANQFGINLLWQAFNTVAVFFYVTVLKVPGATLSTGLIAYGVLNAFLNLGAGYLSDRTHTRWGRRIPYVVLGSLPFGLAFYGLFNPPHWGSSGLVIYFLAFTFIFDLFFTFTALNATALYPEMYQEPGQRSFVAALQQMFGIADLILGVAFAKTLGLTIGWAAMGLIFGLIGALSLYVSVLGSFEDPRYSDQPLAFRQAISETFKNRRFVTFVLASFLIQLVTTMLTTVSSFYSKYVVPLTPLESSIFMGSIFIIAIPVSFVWAKVSLKVGSARATMLSTTLCLVTLLLFLVDRSPLMVMITGAILGFSVSGFLVLLNVVLAEIIDFDALTTGKRREGMYLGMNGFIIRIGLSVQYAIMAAFFAVSRYNARLAVEPSSVIWGFRILQSAVPAIFLAIALLFLKAYRRQVSAADGLNETALGGQP